MRKWLWYIPAKHLCSGQGQEPVAFHLIIYISPDYAECKNAWRSIALAKQAPPYGQNDRGAFRAMAEVFL